MYRKEGAGYTLTKRIEQKYDPGAQLLGISLK